MSRWGAPSVILLALAASACGIGLPPPAPTMPAPASKCASLGTDAPLVTEWSASEKAYLQAATRTTVAGQYRLASGAAPELGPQPACNEATHVVVAVAVGATPTGDPPAGGRCSRR